MSADGAPLLPPPLLEAARAALHEAGDATPVAAVQRLTGGYASAALRLQTGNRAYVLKWNRELPAGAFTAEARGLALLGATGAVRVPLVYAAREAEGELPAFLLLEWIKSGGPGLRRLGEELGARLAEMHWLGRAASYGLDHDNFIGPTPQPNGWQSDWPRFYRERRLLPQIALAERNGLLAPALGHALHKIAERVEDWLGGAARQPALLHGDLWGGNVLVDAAGVPALIDPAAYYGDREAELAYTELFGGFSPSFYAAYEEVWPCEPGREERRDLYNLYHLLNHLNIFGPSYLARVEAAARRYVSL
jgi:fructosamine-3-kinase